MARGNVRQQILGMQGMISGQKHGMYDFIYSTSTTKDPLYNIGDHVKLADGREFVYSKSAGACDSDLGVNFVADGYISYTTITTAASAGDRSMTVPAATHAALTADELRGGYINIFDAGTGYSQFYGIVGNDAADANLAFVIYLDGPLTYEVTTSDACEVYENPYSSLETSSGTQAYTKKAGIPAVYVSAANTYFWCQIAGFRFVSPQGGKLGAINEGNKGLNSAWWSDYGNVSDVETSMGVTVANARGSQLAGYVALGDADNIGPLIKLIG